VKEFWRKYPLGDVLGFLCTVFWGGTALRLLLEGEYFAAFLFGMFAWITISHLLMERALRIEKKVQLEMLEVIEGLCQASREEFAKILERHGKRVEALYQEQDPDKVAP
jgi:hypothetical protein